jgi:hypothetical protein
VMEPIHHQNSLLVNHLPLNIHWVVRDIFLIGKVESDMPEITCKENLEK